ncbi:MAG: hypothetical protein QXR42_05375 [Candidatus Bathyarchaeia archaeon]
MIQEIEVIPVTAEEIVWILGAPTYEEIERILEYIKTLKKERIFNKILVLVNAPRNVK